MQMWLFLGIVFMAACMLRYANCLLWPRGGQAESSEIAEERLPMRRTRSNLPALRIRLAHAERDFAKLGMSFS